MLAFESFRQQQFIEQQQHHFEAELERQSSYPPATMSSFNFASTGAYNNIPFAFYEGPALFADASHDYKYDMTRSTSQGSSMQPSSRHTDMPPYLQSSSASAPSVPSASSSTIGSPYSGHQHVVSSHDIYDFAQSFPPAIVCDDLFPQDFSNTHFDADLAFAQDSKISGSFVDPVLVGGQRESFFHGSTYAPQPTFAHRSQTAHFSPAASPAPSTQSYHSFSHPVTVDNFGSSHRYGRRPSISSQQSGASPQSSCSGDDDSKEKGRCPHPDCGRLFKDLKAHMLTHQLQRPEKCPIISCEYNEKGFARRYDKNRHTLTHYKGTMVCGFCPFSGTAAEKSFNRADVFKRHLTLMHNVEQIPPNSRKRSPIKADIQLSSYCADATGKCSTCSATFPNAQDFYEHLDDCVLRIVQQEEPCEAINAQRLAEVSNNSDVHETLERNCVPSMVDEFDDEEEDEDEDEDENEEQTSFNERCGKGMTKSVKASTSRPIIGGNISKKYTNKKGLTWSRGGGNIIGKGRKRRKNYPPSWGMATDKMNMKKRVLCVYDGGRRLLKDDMMMHNEFEVRVPLREGNNYVTDLDIETLKRAQAFHGATVEEKGPWIQEQDFLQEFLNE